MRTTRVIAGAATAAVLLAGAGCAASPEGAQPTVGQLVAATSPDGHRLRQVPADQAPAVRLEVRPDSESGWNLHLVTERFTFTPQDAGGQARPQQGHAHLYLDGKKIARVYGPWYHLGAADVPAGKHTLMVALNANDHTSWAVDGRMVEAEQRITGGGGGSGGHEHGQQGHTQAGTTQPPAGAGASSAPVDRTVVMRIRQGQVQGAPPRVDIPLGQRIRIEITSDRADEVHVHGYDRSARIPAGGTATLTFTADIPGVFEVETHESGLQLTQLQVS